MPFSSGLPIEVTTLAEGVAGIAGLIGFGLSAPTLDTLGATIDLTGATGTLLNFSFPLPRAGYIESIAAFFSTTVPLNLIGSAITLRAQLYQSLASSNVFEPIPGAEVLLSPSLTGVLDQGSTCSGLASDLQISVAAGTRLLLVFSATAGGVTLIHSVSGYASAGITIV